MTAVVVNGVVVAITITGAQLGFTSTPLVSIASPGTGVGALTVNYAQGSTAGSLNYTPVAGASGTADITVTVTESGGTAIGTNTSISRTFTVVVAPTNASPVVTTTVANLAYIQGARPLRSTRA